LVFYHKGDLDKAQKTLEEIAPARRKGDLAQTSYLLADCLLLGGKTKTGAKMRSQLATAVDLLDDCVAEQPEGEQTPDALLKLGLCHQRLADLTAGSKSRLTHLARARGAYEKLVQQFPQHTLRPRAIFQRAHVLAQAGYKEAAVKEYQRFSADPLKATSVAPLALLQMGVLLREQKKPEEAAKVLAECRQQHEANLLRNSQGTNTAVQLQYHQGLALREAGQFAAAQPVLDNLIRQFPNRPETPDVIVIRGQCARDDAQAKIDAAMKQLARTDLKPPEQVTASQNLNAAYQAMAPAAQYLVDQANQMKQKQPALKARARLLYEAAWCYLELAKPEIAAAHTALQQELLKKMQAEWTKNNPNKPLPNPFPAPEVPLNDVKLQPSEEKARAQYKAIIESFPDLPLAGDARLELAELYSNRKEFPAAIKLLEEALDKDLPKAMTEKIRIGLGACFAAKKDLKAALAQFDVVARNTRSPRASQAQYQAGECLLAVKDYKRAAERLAAFRERKAFRNQPGITDRALLRLGHAYEHLQQWQRSRAAYQRLLAGFPKSPWVHEARYGIAFAWQNDKEYDKAVDWYSRVASGASSETAARAQFQIGLCRVEQKRHGDAVAAFLLVPFYEHPEWSAAALCEAARTLARDKKPKQAETLLRRVMKDFAQTKWAEVAQERLERMK
jgi:TolA-binding protein